jgi:Ca2+:H+ antiporter
VEKLSLTTAASMLILYLLFVVYALKSCNKERCDTATAREAIPIHSWSAGKSMSIMGLSMAGIALMSELLVSSVEAVTDILGLTPFFVGIIIVPIIGNVAEHLVSVQAAIQNKMDLSLSIALGSSLQIALFVTPVLVFVSLLLQSPLTLQFNQLELIALTAASMISALVSLDGESNWLEGAMLLAVYGILGMAFFFLPLSL